MRKSISVLVVMAVLTGTGFERAQRGVSDKAWERTPKAGKIMKISKTRRQPRPRKFR